MPYVYTKPEPETRLTHKDKVFVLSIENINKYFQDEKKEEDKKDEEEKKRKEAEKEIQTLQAQETELNTKLSEVQTQLEKIS